MKAIVWTKYGPPGVLQLHEVAPPAPSDQEVLIRICATTVTAGDCEVRSLRFPLWFRLPFRLSLGFRKPLKQRLGKELAGEVEAVGKEVTRFRKGDQVFGKNGSNCSTYAEYICLPENGVLAIKPSTLTYEEAAPMPVGGLEAWHLLKKGDIQRGQKVLILGAGGSIGTFAVQIAKSFGAEVTAVDSPGKLEMLRSLGADHVIDYTQDDFTKSGETYEVIFDVVGKSAFSRSVRALKPNGRYLLANPRLSQMVGGQRTLRSNGKTVIPWTIRAASAYMEDIKFLTELIETGKIQSAIDRCYPLEQTAEAHRYVETGQKKGNVVITVSHTTQPKSES